ncbi:Hypothetical predicted protein, partial [Xyrichtys novacula]
VELSVVRVVPAALRSFSLQHSQKAEREAWAQLQLPPGLRNQASMKETQGAK